MEKNLCLLIDFENIAAGTEKDGLGRFDVNLVLERLADKGRVLIARSYADWGRFARFKQGLLTSNVSMMELTSHGMQDKNRADIALVVEGMELAFTKPYIDTFVIVSGDSDFTPMVLKMRELDKRVIGCGCRSSTSRLLIQACDEFIFYDNLAKRQKTRREKQSTRRKGSEPSLDTALELLVNTLEGLQRENPDPPHASVVKSAMLRKSPDFSENDLGFSSLARFLERARKQGIVKLIRDEKSGGYRVDQVSNGDGDEGDSRDHQRGGGRRGGSDDGVWLDPYLPKETAKYVEILASAGLNPLAAPTRKAILESLEEIVEFREKKKRRVTVHFVQDDVIKRLRKTHPDVPHKAVRNVFNGLMRANAFIHRDGNPVRTGSAQFGLEKSAEELNATLADIYIYELIGNGARLNVGPIAELLYGDSSRTRPVEESIAYHQANAAEVDDDGDDDRSEVVDLDELDVDMLLLSDDDDDDTSDAKADTPDETPKAKTKAKSKTKAKAKSKTKTKTKTKAKSKTKTKSKAKAAEPSDDEKRAAAAEEQESEETPPVTKKKAASRTKKKASTTKKVTASRRKAASKADEDAETSADASADADADADADAEAPKKRRRVRKKRTEEAPEAPEAPDDDLDSLLSSD